MLIVPVDDLLLHRIASMDNRRVLEHGMLPELRRPSVSLHCISFFFNLTDQL